MNHLELQALRQLCFLSINEAATYISGDSNVTQWQNWEKGVIYIPNSVSEKLQAMNINRRQRLNAIIDKINNRIGNNTMRFFPEYDAFRVAYPEEDYLGWKVYQSVAAELYSDHLEHLC